MMGQPDKAAIEAFMADAPKRMECAAERARKLILEGEGRRCVMVRPSAGVRLLLQKAREERRHD